MLVNATAAGTNFAMDLRQDCIVYFSDQKYWEVTYFCKEQFFGFVIVLFTVDMALKIMNVVGKLAKRTVKLQITFDKNVQIKTLV